MKHNRRRPARSGPHPRAILSDLHRGPPPLPGRKSDVEDCVWLRELRARRSHLGGASPGHPGVKSVSKRKHADPRVDQVVLIAVG